MVDLSNPAPSLAPYALAPPVTLFVLPHQGNSTQNVGVRTGAGEFILRTYPPDSQEQRLRQEHALLTWLGTAALPFAVPIPVRTRTGDTLVWSPNGWQALSSRLPGERLDWQDPSQLIAFGAALGELQTTLARYPVTPYCETAPLPEHFGANSWIADLSGRPLDDLQRPATPPHDGVGTWWGEEIAQLQSFVATTYKTLPWQVIHNDFIPTNVLVQDQVVTAVLDFEFAQVDVRVVDLANSLRNVVRLWEADAPWERIARCCAGYQDRIQLRDSEISAIPLLMRLRNAWRVLRLIGRPREEDAVHPAIQHIEHARQFVGWLADHEGQLLCTIRAGTR